MSVQKKSGLQSLLSSQPMPQFPALRREWDLVRYQQEMERFHKQLIDYLKHLTGSFTATNIVNEIITNITETNPVFGDLCKLLKSCDNGVLMYSTGEIFVNDGTNDVDQKWTIRENYTGSFTNGYLVSDGAWYTPEAGLSWISKVAAKSGSGADCEYRTIVPVLGYVNRPTLTITLGVSADQAITEIYVNGVAQGITPVPDPAYNKNVQFVLTGKDFIVGNNEVIVKTSDLGIIQGLYLKVKRITW